MWNLLRGSTTALLSKARTLVGHTHSADYLVHSLRYPEYLRRGNAALACKFHAAQFCKGRGLDVGASNWCFPGARPINLTSSEDAYQIREESNSQDYLFSSHCLEHLTQWERALDEWLRVLKPGGILYLYLPHPAATLWNTGVHPDHHWTPNPPDVAQACTARGLTIVEMSWLPDGYLSFYVVGRKGADLNAK